MDDGPANLEARLRAIEFLVANLYGIENRRVVIGMLLA